MKRLFTIFAFVLPAFQALAWDVEHDEVAQLTGEFLPAEIRRTMAFDDFGTLLACCHFPDQIEWAMPDGARRFRTLDEIAAFVGEDDKRILERQGFRDAWFFHTERGRAVSLALMAKAFQEGRSRRAAFYLSVLTHTIADQSALNHTPLLHFMHTVRFPDVDCSVRKVEPGSKNVFGFRSDGYIVHLVRQRLADWRPRRPSGDFTAECERLVAQCVVDGSFAAEKEGVIAFAPVAEAEKALAELVAMQVRRILDFAWTAWTLRATWTLPGADFDARVAERMAGFNDSLDPAVQSVFSDVFDQAKNPADPKATVGVVCEPYGVHTITRLSFAGRLLTAAAARTLRDHGYAVRPFALKAIAGGFPPPQEMPILFVDLGRSRLTTAQAGALKAYVKSGGRLIAVGGEDPADVSGFHPFFSRRGDDELPVSGRWGVCNLAGVKKMSVLSGGVRTPLKRNPNIEGFCKPYAMNVIADDPSVTPLVRLDNGRETFTVAARRGPAVWLSEYLLMPFIWSDDTALNWREMRLDPFGAKLLMEAVAGLDVASSRVVLPEKYARDPGAGFALVFLTDLESPTAAVRAFADRYKDAVIVCAKGAERAALLKEVCANYRVYRFPRGRIDLTASDLVRPDAEKCLANYVDWGRYQSETPLLTRYGARIYRKVRAGGAAPVVKLPQGWRLVDGDDGATGCDSRLYYFTVEADGANLPPPEVRVDWPGVEISSVDGAKNVTIAKDRVVLTPTAKSGGANYATMVQNGAIELGLYHHVEGAQHGPYGDRPLPWTQIRSSANWLVACREVFRRMGFLDPKAAKGADIKLYGFDSNFPNRHMDHPEHFHIMLEWDNWEKNNVGHYTLDARGRIKGNNFLLCGDVKGGRKNGYHRQKLGETTSYTGPDGKALFSVTMLEDGCGLLLRKPGDAAEWRIWSDRPAESVSVSVRKNAAAQWEDLGCCSVSDDTESGTCVIRVENKGKIGIDTFRYDRDTGRLLGKSCRAAACNAAD